MKIVFGIFSDPMSIPASMMSAYILKNKGWDVDTIFFQDNDENKIIEQLTDSRIDILALSMKTFERSLAFQVAALAKKIGIKVICGGTHPTYAPEDVQSSLLFDAIIVGDGMGVLDDILDNHHELKDNTVISGKTLKDKRFYAMRYYTEKQKQLIQSSKMYELLTNIGCFGKCTFCATNRNFFKIPIDVCAEVLIQDAKELDFKSVCVHDDIFTLSAKRLKQFRTLLEKEGMSFFFHVNGRTSIFAEKVAEELIAFGATDIVFGVETASSKLSTFLRKKGSYEDACRTAIICRKYDLPFKINLLLGLPTQDKEDYELTLDFLQETKPDTIYLNHFVPFPGSYLFDYCIKNGYMPDNWSYKDYCGVSRDNKDFKGFRQGFGMLKQIDYELVEYYHKKIKEFENQLKDTIIYSKIKEIDDRPWVIFGTGTYFYRVIDRIWLHKTNWKNLLGFYDYWDDNQSEREFFKEEINTSKMPRFAWSKISKIKPEVVVVTTHEDGNLLTIDLPYLRNKLNYDGEIVSVSSYQ